MNFFILLFVLVLIFLLFNHFNSKNERQCPKCKKEDTSKEILRLDANANYQLPTDELGNKLGTTQIKCLNCGHIWWETDNSNPVA